MLLILKRSYVCAKIYRNPNEKMCTNFFASDFLYLLKIEHICSDRKIT